MKPREWIDSHGTVWKRDRLGLVRVGGSKIWLPGPVHTQHGEIGRDLFVKAEPRGVRQEGEIVATKLAIEIKDSWGTVFWHREVLISQGA